MLTRKIICCAFVLAFMLMLGWRLQQSVMAITSDHQVDRISTDNPLFRSAGFSEPIPVSMPFLPREYVRVQIRAD